MRRASAGLTVLAVCALAGCNSPVAPQAPAGARFTGYTYGSGNSVAPQPPTPTATADSAMTVESDTTLRGGYTYGSGN